MKEGYNKNLCSAGINKKCSEKCLEYEYSTKMLDKKGLNSLKKGLKKQKIIAMLAPSFVIEFEYPEIISQLKDLGFEKVTELTFGAKMINREYHKQLKTSEKLLIASVCPRIAETIIEKCPMFKENVAKIDSPMIATAKICKKFYPEYKTCFLSPCFAKKIEAHNSDYVDYAITYQELKQLISLNNGKNNYKISFDRFYNDYTKIYPIAGGLSKTAHLNGIIKKGQEKIIDGIQDVEKFLNKPDKKIKFLDVTFCKGGCIGGPCITNKLTIKQKDKKILDYLAVSKREEIPGNKKGLIEKAQGIKFSWD